MADTRKFRFVSPGVFLDEVDNSQLPKIPDEVGPVIIGRTLRGPGLKPVRVESLSEFIEVFGEPVAGGDTGDVWRNGNRTSPMYATYAAQAWLKNTNALTVVRLLGAQHPEAVVNAGSAGWDVDNAGTSLSTNGGAYGLWVMASGSNDLTGTLAAVWYVNTGHVKLEGNFADGGATGDTVSKGVMDVVRSQGSDHQYKAVIMNDTTSVITASFNFEPTSDLYIRNVFNTDPTALGTINSAAKNYFLGETFEKNLYTVAGTSTSFAYVAPITLGHNHKREFTEAKTGYVIAQDFSSDHGNYDPAAMDKLFRLVAIDAGEEVQRTVKISVSDIKASLNPTEQPYGTFTIEVRSISDTDGSKKVLETFSQCNLNPNSPNFIAKKLGDKHMTWDNDKKRYLQLGSYANMSKYVRAELTENVQNGSQNPLSLPFGFFGPVRLEDNVYVAGAMTAGNTIEEADSVPLTTVTDATIDLNVSGASSESGSLLSARMVFPKISLRANTTEGEITDPSLAYFGFDTTQRNNNRFEKSVLDLLRPNPISYNTFASGSAGSSGNYHHVFSLDNVKYYSGSGGATLHGAYSATARTSGESLTCTNPTVPSAGTSYKGTYSSPLDAGFDSFTMPIFGGADGLDITERDPFRNSLLSGYTTDESSYARYSLKRAVDSISDPEVLEMNLAAIPGITDTGIIDHLITTCEARADALAVIDLPGGYDSIYESTSTEQNRLGSTTTVINNLKTRGLNTSYACAFHPWVQAKDTLGSSGLIWMPPSVAALGTFSSNDRKAAPWFAPAGFTRGGLTEGAAGIPIVGVREHLTRKERDKLYERNVNPIAKFPAEGIVVFGQKTMQTTPSALDRINVRRLMIHVKKGISRIASRMLFTPNVSATWQRFKDEANPFLEQIKNEFGLDDFRVVLDSTTTTSDLVDRNVMYAKVLLKPTRVTEFIAIDFVILRSGASFDD
jgi:hypothetical protein